MSDIISNTAKRFVPMSDDFHGASDNDLVRIAAQAIDYAGEISLRHSQTTEQVPVAYCVFGTPFRDVVTNNDHETTMAAVIRDIRENGITWQGYDQFEFEYDGMTFQIMTESVYEDRCSDAIEMMTDEAEYEAEQLLKNSCYVSNYMKFDREAFARDLQYDIEGLVSHYDGTVHEMYWNEYTSGDGSLVTRRGTLYMIRED